MKERFSKRLGLETITAEITIILSMAEDCMI